jgi:CobQ-like glutamine amidotransferase family enzyme
MRIEVLFPEICNLYGDLFNIEFLKRSCPEIEIVNTSLKSEPLFSTDRPVMIYMGSTTERGQEIAANKLLPYKDRITGLIGDGALFLLTGNAGELFGTHIQQENGESITCLDILPAYAIRQMMNRYNSLYTGKFGDMDIVGFKGQFSHSYGDNSDCYFIETTRGDGLNPGSKYEGMRINNLFSTYIIGPLLPLNPPLAKYFLNLLGVDEPKLVFEEECFDAYYTRVKEFCEPTRGFLY